MAGTELGGRDVLSDIDMLIHAGEVLGIAGVEGNGQAELVDAIMGIRPIAGGTIELGGKDIGQLSTSAPAGGRRRLHPGGPASAGADPGGLALGEPDSRPPDPAHPPPADSCWIARPPRRTPGGSWRSSTSGRPGIEVTAASLSGGNQQKLIVGREMSEDPVLLIASHPTRGVDVGAQAAIWEHLRTARAAGLAVLLISADLEELIGMSDTLTVILRGRLIGTYDPQDGDARNSWAPR